MEIASASNRGSTCTCIAPKNSDHDIDDVLSQFRRDQSQLIPILQKTQQELGYLPEESLHRIAVYLTIPASTVFGVATFYALFRLSPAGRRTVRVCRGTACHVRGANRILQEFEKRLGIKAGETSPDLENTLQTIACFGSCALAPVAVVGEKVYGRLTPSRVEKVLHDTESR